MRTLILVIVVVFGINLSFGQSDNFRFGVTANPGFSWYKPDNKFIESDGVRFNFTYGLIIDYAFGSNERYAINGGLQINLAGGRLMSTDTLDMVTSLSPKIQYFEIPLSIKLRSNEVKDDFIFYGQMGIVPGIPFRKRAKYSSEDTEDDNIALEDLPLYPNVVEKAVPFHFGLLIEAGMEYALSENTFLIGGLFFNTGFTNVLKDGDDDRIVMRNFGLRIGVLF